MGITIGGMYDKWEYGALKYNEGIARGLLLGFIVGLILGLAIGWALFAF